MRRLTEGEQSLARSVFGDALDPARVRVVPIPASTAVTVGPLIFMPYDAPRDFASAALHLKAWLVHELTHVWQFAGRPLATLGNWAKVAASGGYGPGQPGYRYDLPFTWEALNLEQQARVVEHAFLMREGATVRAATPSGAPLRATQADYAGRTPFEALDRRV